MSMNTVRSRIHEYEYYKISVFIFIIHEYSCIHEALWKYHAAVCHTLYVTRSMPHTDTYNTAVEARNTWTRHMILALSYPTVRWLDCRRGTRPVDETHGRDACETHRYIRHGRRRGRTHATCARYACMVAARACLRSTSTLNLAALYSSSSSSLSSSSKGMALSCSRTFSRSSASVATSMRSSVSTTSESSVACTHAGAGAA